MKISNHFSPFTSSSLAGGGMSHKSTDFSLSLYLGVSANSSILYLGVSANSSILNQWS